jgi:acetate kinase
LTTTAAASATDRVLTINAGSSSVKYALFAAGPPSGRSQGRSGPSGGSGRSERGGTTSGAEAPLLAGNVEGLGEGGMDHVQALAQIVERVREQSAKGQRIAAVGHRVVHGGTRFAQPALIDDEVLAQLHALAPLAPLHQPHNLAGVAAARAAFAQVPQVACFDTAFHRTQPVVHQRFAIPGKWHDAGVRRYGFHGLSYESICAQLAADEPALAAGRVVVAHLGNGASMCAIARGRSVATTMSFSPLDGLTMSTRCGRIDAAAVLHLIDHHGLDTAAVATLLTRQSGLLGLSGQSSDMRVLMASTSADAALALEHFVESAVRELAVMAAALRGIDALVFTGGIGENAAAMRERIVVAAAWMGVRLDARANDAGERCIDAPASSVRVRVLRTNEEAVIARHARRAAGLVHH